MMRGTTAYFNPQPGIEIRVSWPAQQMLGLGRGAEFVKLVTEIMEALGCHAAYISKCGAAVEIHVLRKDGWAGVMKAQKGK